LFVSGRSTTKSTTVPAICRSSPLCFGGLSSAFRGGVAQQHRGSALPCAFNEHVRRVVVNLRLQRGQRARQIFRRMGGAFAVDELPLEFQSRRTRRVQGLHGDGADRPVEALQVGERPLVIRAAATPLKHCRGMGRPVCGDEGAERRKPY